eukprot:jgi/Undpi1/14064/HiC_scaffold_9.g03715.m1
MPDIEDKPTPEAVADTVEQAAEEIVQDVKEVKEDVTDSTAGASLSDALASVKSGLATVKGWSQAAGRTAGGAWATVGSWKEQGTPLRGFFKSARLSLNDASAEIRHMNDAREKNMKERMQEMMKKRKARFEELDKSGMLTKCGEMKRQHPEIIVGGFTLAVALPSALAGKRALFRNSVGALTLSATVVYGGEWFKRRMLARSEERRPDSGPPRP